nr:DUF1294 domain-containing protein [Phycisphaeraceae bacterium]
LGRRLALPEDVMQLWLTVLAIDLVMMSTVTLGFYAWDKRQASKHGWRVPEKRLHLLALLGGWPGALLGQRWLRHKSVKTRFRLVFWLTVFVHITVAAGITYLLWSYGRSA